MSENIYEGDAASIESVDLEAPLGSAKGPTCDYYHTAYGRAAGEALESNDEKAAAAYAFLSKLCSFHPTYHSHEAPYGPYCSFEDGRRGYVPQDLTEADIDVIRSIRNGIADHALLARLGDILWIAAKDHKAAADAAEAYLESGKDLMNGDHWTEVRTQFTRAFQLAALHGRDKPLWQRVANEVEATTLAIPETDTSFKACQLMNVLLDAGAGTPDAFVGRAAKYAVLASSEDDHYKARDYWKVETRWCRAAKDSDGEKAAKLAAAETHAAEADAHLAKPKPSYFAAGHCLARGVEALRQAGGDKAHIAELKGRLLDYQKQSMDEMKKMEYQVDIADVVASTRKHVEADTFEEAVRLYAFGHPLTDLQGLRDDVLRLQKEFPIATLFATTFVDGEGRVKGHKKGLSGLRSEALEEEIEAEMFRHASQYLWGVRVASYIEPGRHVIWNQHHPQIPDVAYLVNHNPFVPPGHEIIFGRGLLAGFAGDFIMSSHFLVPQIENSLRHVLQAAGHDITNLQSDMTQPVKILGPLFDMPAMKEIFGEAMVFELRGVLIEKTGHELRNRIAHGFSGTGDCHTPAALMTWWLVLRLCVIGHLLVRDGQTSTTSDEGKTETETPDVTAEETTA